jgi:hypothetical protein
MPSTKLLFNRFLSQFIRVFDLIAIALDIFIVSPGRERSAILAKHFHRLNSQ